MIKLYRYLRPYWLGVLATLAFVYAQVMASLQLPDYMATIVNQGIVLGDNGLILRTGGKMLLVTLLGAAATVCAGYLASRIATGFARDIRHAIFARAESFSLAEFNSFSTASLLTRTTNDIQQVQQVTVMMLRLFAMAPIMGIGAVIKALDTAPSMSWIIGLAVGVLMVIIIVLFAIALPRFQKLQKLVDRLNLVTRQALTGLRVIKAFNNEKAEEHTFDRANRDLTSANLFVNRLMVVMQPVMMLILNLTTIGVIWVGAHQINAGDLQIGGMIAFMQYAMQTIMAFLFISMIFIMVPRAAVSGQRIIEVIDTEPTIKDPEKPVKAPQGPGVVEFRNVSFTYPTADTPVLEHISFTAEPGQTTAFIGSTGSGKSTLINLIPRFYDVTEGSIAIDGVDIRDLKLEDLYAKMGYVPQKGVLFSGTVESNIKYGAPDISEGDVKKATETAQATEFVKGLENGYQGTIAQGGQNVSGGQKQRLSIARALARTPEIYIFDDSFSALDFKTDAALRQALKAETAAKTVLIVAQRISTILDAAKIIVLDEGRIVGSGTHEELMRSCSVYQEIARSQLSDEELSAYSHMRALEGATV